MDRTLLTEALKRMHDAVPVTVWRVRAHDAFDRLWQDGGMTRTEAYAWLADAMGMTSTQAHIVNFNADECRHLLGLVQQKRLEQLRDRFR